MYFSARERHKYGSRETLVWLTSHTCIAREPCKCPRNEWQVSYKGGKNGVKKEGAERNPYQPEHRKENYHIFAAKCFCYLSDEYI